MNFLQQFISKLYILDRHEIKKYLLFTILGFIGLIVLIQFFFIYQTNQVIVHIEDINKKRTEIKQLLQKKIAINQEKERVEKIIVQDSQFRIKEYVNNIVNQLKLQKKLGKPLEALNEQDAGNGYSEVGLNGFLKGVTTRELVAFLQSIEGNKRVYFKEVKITTEASKVVDLNFTVATLKMELAGK